MIINDYLNAGTDPGTLHMTALQSTKGLFPKAGFCSFRNNAQDKVLWRVTNKCKSGGFRSGFR